MKNEEVNEKQYEDLFFIKIYIHDVHEFFLSLNWGKLPEMEFLNYKFAKKILWQKYVPSKSRT